MKRTVNTKIVWLFVLLVAIIFASTMFGTFESFVGSAPGIGNTGIGAGAMAQQAKANYNSAGIGNTGVGSGPIAQQAKANYQATGSMMGTKEGFWTGPRARAYRQGNY